jgi:hypothetical protein
MRLAVLAAAAALSLAFAAEAAAGPVAVKPLAVDAELQKKFETDYGVRELPELTAALNAALARALRSNGGDVGASGGVTIETTLLDVRPSKPTMQQTHKRPGLDTIRSVSLGGGKFRARLVSADGRVLNEFTYDWYERDLFTSPALTTWHDARDAMRRFAARVGVAYAAHAG